MAHTFAFVPLPCCFAISERFSSRPACRTSSRRHHALLSSVQLTSPQPQQLHAACLQVQSFSPQARKLTRRAVLSLVAASVIATTTTTARASQAEKIYVPPYDANKSRRYVEIGRPAPDRPAPQFESGKKLFSINPGLEAQDVRIGQGQDAVKAGSLVVARWSMVLEDGTTVDTANEEQPAIFRPGAHQVPPGIEDSVIGMLPGGVRKVKGTSERILANVALGYDIGERSLVPNGSNMFIEVAVDRINPYGPER